MIDDYLHKIISYRDEELQCAGYISDTGSGGLQKKNFKRNIH